uniref:Uncharacterized protein n=1 Tax=Rhizophora mucronata TaxID=61149 RepID=A0A2P2Q4V0_RHIMU
MIVQIQIRRSRRE